MSRRIEANCSTHKGFPVINISLDGTHPVSWSPTVTGEGPRVARMPLSYLQGRALHDESGKPIEIGEMYLPILNLASSIVIKPVKGPKGQPLEENRCFDPDVGIVRSESVVDLLNRKVTTPLGTVHGYGYDSTRWISKSETLPHHYHIRLRALLDTNLLNQFRDAFGDMPEDYKINLISRLASLNSHLTIASDTGTHFEANEEPVLSILPDGSVGFHPKFFPGGKIVSDGTWQYGGPYPYRLNLDSNPKLFEYEALRLELGGEDNSSDTGYGRIIVSIQLNSMFQEEIESTIKTLFISGTVNEQALRDEVGTPYIRFEKV